MPLEFARRQPLPRAAITLVPLRPLAVVIPLLALGLALPAQAEEPSDEPTVLEPLSISDSALRSRPGVTEGSQSYTSDSARTATPLNMSLRETPQSVSVVTRQRIEDQDLRTILDVVNNATGISVNRYETSRAQFNARGFEVNSLMIDGVPTIWEQPWSSGEIFNSLAIYDRVEVVRGANGLMTGAGDPSASINMVRKRASSRVLAGSLEASAGSWDTYGTLGDLSMPLNESGSVRARLVGEYTDGDSWIDLHATQRETLYGTMDIDLTPDTTLWFGLSRQQSQSDSPMWGGLPVWYTDGGRTNWSRSKTTSADWSRWDNSYKSYFVNLDHEFANGWQANLSYNRSERTADSRLLYVYTYADRAAVVPMATMPGAYQTETLQDDYSIRFDGPLELFGRSHELAFGYVKSQQDFDADTRQALSGWGGIADFDSYDGRFPAPLWGAKTEYGYGDIEQKGLYAATRLNLSDRLKVILGARESRYRKAADDIFSSPSKTDVGSEITPYAGIVYDLTNSLSAYLSYTEIFLPQSVRDRSGQQLEPIVGESSEAGLKAEFYDGRLNASVAIFQIKQDNLGQSTGVFIPGTAELAYAASEGATSEGFELEVSGELATGWNVTAGYTQFKAEDANGRGVNTLYPSKLLRTYTTYRLPGALNRLTIGGGVNWQDAIHTYAANPAGAPEKIQQDAYALVNLMARYDITDNLSAQLNANNLTDEKYYDIFDAFGAMTYGAPRSLTASAKYRF